MSLSAHWDNDLPLELSPDDSDEPSSLRGPNAQPDTQGISRYRLLMGGAMSRVLQPRPRQKHLQRTAARHPSIDL